MFPSAFLSLSISRLLSAFPELIKAELSQAELVK